MYWQILAILSASAVIGLILEFILDTGIKRIFSKTTNEIDDIVVGSVKYLIFWLSLLLGLKIIQEVTEVPGFLTDQNLIALSIGLITIFIIRLSNNTIHYVNKKTGSENSTIIENTIIGMIIGLSVLVILQNYGISITPLLTALGVGGIAIALALQETLSSFISGINLVATNKIKVGNYIKLSTGEEGTVIDITWRNTTVQQLDNNTLIIPNQKLSQEVVTNYNKPQKEMSLFFDIGVSYDADLEKVEKITNQVGKKILETVEGGVEDFEPFIRYNNFDDFSITFTIILRVKGYVSQYLIKHEFLKALKKAYDENGIEIPFPVRTVKLEKEK